MENRLKFIAGDIGANVLIATLCLGVTTFLIGGSWGMLPGMLAGMLLGMFIALMLSMGWLVRVLGIMEIITPCMLSGMFAGMFGGMWALGFTDVLKLGTAIGLVTLAAIYALNAVMTGPQRLEHWQ